MKKMDFDKPYGVVLGGELGERFEQNGIIYNAEGDPHGGPSPAVKDSRIIPTDALENAKSFLNQILKDGPVSKSVVFKTAEQNNQPWDQVTLAASELNIMKFKFGNTEQWKLTEV